MASPVHGGDRGRRRRDRPLGAGPWRRARCSRTCARCGHALKGTGYEPRSGREPIGEVETAARGRAGRYAFNPVTTAADARVVGFPMPGGAIGPQRAHDGRGGHPRPLRRGAGRVPRGRQGGRRLDQRHALAASSTGCRPSTTCSTAAGRRSTAASASRCSATSAVTPLPPDPEPSWRSPASSSSSSRSTAIPSRRRPTASSRRARRWERACRSARRTCSWWPRPSCRARTWTSTRASGCSPARRASCCR